LNGKVGVQGSEEEQTSYIAPGCGAIGRIHATTPQASLHGGAAIQTREPALAPALAMDA